MWGKERKFVEAKTTHFQKRTSKAVKVRKELNIDSRLRGRRKNSHTTTLPHWTGKSAREKKGWGNIIYNNNHCLKGSRPPIPLNKTEQ